MLLRRRPFIPAPAAVGFPAGKHLRLASAHGAAVVRRQDGVSAEVALVRPMYPNSPIVSTSVHNTAAVPSKAVYWGYNPGWLAIQNGLPVIIKELSSADDGVVGTDLYQELSDGTYIQLPLTLRVERDPTTAAANVPGAVNGSDPANAVDSPDFFFDDFTDPRRGTGALWVSYAAEGASVGNNGSGGIFLSGRSSANQPFSGPTAGFGNGLFEYWSRYVGPDIGDGSGPCQLLWPSDNRWNNVPGYPDHWTREIDLGELMGDGTFYVAIHWTDQADEKKDGDRLFTPKGHPVVDPGGVFDHTQNNLISVFTQTDRLRMYVNRKLLADVTDHPAPDYANGGVNRSFGILCNSSNRGLVVDSVAWTSEAAVLARGGPYPA